MALYNVAVGGLPQASDLNQLIDVFNGVHDVGTITFAPVVSAPTTTGFSLTTQAGTTLGVGVYQYKFTYVTGYYKSDGTLVITGETDGSPFISITTTTGNTTVKVTLPVPAVSAVCATRIYRTTVGGSSSKLLATVKDGTTVYTDSTADGSLGAGVPLSNTTGTNLNINDGFLSGVTYFQGQYGRVATSRSDNWLGINDQGTVHTAGVYFGSSIVRTDGQLQVGASGTKFLVDSSGNVTALKYTATAESHFANGTYSDPFSGTGQAIKASGGIASDTFHASGVITSTVATGTAPFTVASTTKVTNLNADMVDGYSFNQDVQTTASPTFANVTLSNDPTAAMQATTKQFVDRKIAVVSENTIYAKNPMDNYPMGTISTYKFNSALSGNDWIGTAGIVVTNSSKDTVDDNKTGAWYPPALHQTLYQENSSTIYHRHGLASKLYTGISVWAASTAIALNALYMPTSAKENGYYYKCTTAGTTGATEPTWPTSGTVTDGTAVWTLVQGFWSPWVKSVVDDGSGNVTLNTVTSTVATGTAPFTVTSTTKVTNLNADQLDGLDSTSFLRSDADDTMNNNLTIVQDKNLNLGTSGHIVGSAAGVISVAAGGSLNLLADSDASSASEYVSVKAGNNELKVISSAASTSTTNLTYNGNKVYHAGNDGSGSGIDADLLDGLHATDFQRADGTTSIATGNTSGTYNGQYNKVATINVTAQYGFVNTSLLFMGGADGSTNLRKAIVDIRVKQQAAMASAPIYEFDLIEANGGVVAGDFVAVISANTASTTTVDLYFRISNQYEQYSFVSLIKNTSSGTLALLSGQPFVATLPTGTQITCTDITKAKKTGDTFTGAITAPSFTSNVATGTAPFTVASTTKVANLNADMVDGYSFNQDVQTTASPTFATVTGTGAFIGKAQGSFQSNNGSTPVTIFGYSLAAGNYLSGSIINDTIIRNETSGNILLGFNGASGSESPALALSYNGGTNKATAKTQRNTLDDGVGGATFIGNVTAPAFVSNVATGTAPFTVTSTTPVANLAIGGNAGSATKLATARTIATSGDATGTATSFDGSANITIPLTLAASGVTAGTYKSVTVDAKGRVTGGTNPITLAGYGITDVDNTNYGIVAGSNANGSYIQYPDGTMICWASIAAVAGTTIENTGVLTYPVTFVAQPYTTVQHYSLAGKFANWYIYNNATNGFTLYHQGLAGVDLSTTSFRWIAIGKWK
jgi:hypothetical protein